MIPHRHEAKLGKRINRLAGWRYKKVADVPLDIGETMEHFRKPPAGLERRPAPVGTRWGKEWGSAWFHGAAAIPKECKGKRVYFRMLTWGEMLLFVNGKPFAGMDHKHQEVVLVEKARGGEKIPIDVEAYAGHRFPENDPTVERMRWHQSIGSPPHPIPLDLNCSEILVEREHTCALFYDLDVLHRTALLQPANSLRRATLLDRVNEALDMIPFHPASDEELEAAAAAARRHVAPLLKEKNSNTTPHIGLVGHTHIDIGWLWPVRESIRKAARTFSTFLGLMERYPDLTFLQSQPVLLEMVEQHYPALLPRIKQAVKAGRWEPNGGMYVEADCNLSGGESLIRQFLEGIKITERLFGYRSDTLWLPDVFGYSAALPQILKKCEIRNFVTQKICWNDTNQFPYSTFWWEGIDGTEIFAHYHTSGYNSEVSPDFSHKAWDGVKVREAQDSQIMSVGFGDGGGGVTPEMCENALRIRDLEGCPRTSFVNGSKFLQRLREQEVKRPRWTGELYLELHRGTYTTQARTKRYNRKLEFLLRDVEFLSVLAQRHGLRYPAAELERNWKILLLNQFHDIIPGSSIRKVYEVAEAEYAQMEKDLGALRDAAMGKLAGALNLGAEGEPFVAANTLSWGREEIVFLPGAYKSAMDADGKPLPVQPVVDGGKKKLAALLSTDGLSVAPVYARKAAAKADGGSVFKHGARSLETPFYKVRFDAAGKIVSLYDKAARREIAQAGRRLNEIYSAEDVPFNWDAWELSAWYRDKIVMEDRLLAREVVAEGSLFFAIRSTYAIGRKSKLVQDMIFYAHSRRIDFRTEVDWQERHVILKAGFPVDVLADSCRAEIQYGHLVRGTHENTSYDKAKFEACMHKWVDVSETGYGVAVLNDCKYGYDALDKMISVTLLKATVSPDEIADQGHHRFTYSLLPHPGDFSVESVACEGYALNVPIVVSAAQKGHGTETSLSFCSVSNPNVIIEAVKKAEDGGAAVVRLYEAGRSRGPVTLRFAKPVRRVAECNLLERQESEMRVKGDSITFDIKPFEIRTFKVTLG